MVETRIKPYREQVAEQGRRAEQRRLTLRHQVFGLLIVAAAIPRWWLIDTYPKWTLPAGWRRL